MLDEQPAKKPFIKRRRARPSLKVKQARRAEEELAKLERQRKLEEKAAARMAEAKQAIEFLISQTAEERRALAAATRPQAVVDLCKQFDLPPDIAYHPRYNAIGVPPETDDQTLESILFGRCWPAEFGGLGGYEHLKNFIAITWPWIKWNPWFERTLRAVADDDYAIQVGDVKTKFINITGPGSASKSFASGVISCAWFMVDYFRRGSPRTSVTLTSTSKAIINQRVWPVIQRCFHDAIRQDGLGPAQKLKWGHMVDSQKMVLSLRQDGTKDAQHSICALAVESGEVNKAVNNIKGRHAERMMLIVDEANTTPEAIFNCIPNMLTSVKEMIVIVIGNAVSRLDSHGQCCEPARGWKSITIEDEAWDTKGVAKWSIGPGVCLHYDGAKSPNVMAGRTLYEHIYSFERWQSVLRMGDEYRNTVQHWSQDRGFWPPDGMQTTVFSEAMVISHDGTGKFNWLSEPRPCAALDPAFGGDNCVLQFGLLGEVPGNRLGLQLTDWVLVPFDPESTDAIDYQIALYVIQACRKRSIDPGYFGLDATGTGRGVAAFLNQLWSNRVHGIEFGGAASDMPASADDPRPGNEVYSNRVTELWYSARDILLADQLKGLHQQAIIEACARIYEFVNRRYRVEPKSDMKKRLGYSPDYFDAIAVLIDVARRNGLTARPMAARRRQAEEDTSLDQLDALYEGAYSSDHEFSTYAPIPL
jgi:hypothetical protein